MLRLATCALLVLACSPAAPAPEPVSNTAPAEPPEPTRRVLFVAYGSALIPAICFEGSELLRGERCLTILDDSVEVRLSSGQTATAARSTFECGPTEEVTAVWRVPEAAAPESTGGAVSFAVSPPAEASARVEVTAVNREADVDLGPLFSIESADDSILESLATSDIDGDGSREAVVRHDYGHGEILAVARIAAGRRSQVLFSWECGS